MIPKRVEKKCIEYGYEQKGNEMPGRQKIKEIYDVLPKLNCGYCGFKSCGQFAKAVVEGRASFFGCRQNPWAGYRISEIIGMQVPTTSYGFYQMPFVSRKITGSALSLRENIGRLHIQTDDILTRIESLMRKRKHA